jgi:hypothetical protein
MPFLALHRPRLSSSSSLVSHPNSRRRCLRRVRARVLHSPDCHSSVCASALEGCVFRFLIGDYLFSGPLLSPSASVLPGAHFVGFAFFAFRRLCLRPLPPRGALCVVLSLLLPLSCCFPSHASFPICVAGGFFVVSPRSVHYLLRTGALCIPLFPRLPDPSPPSFSFSCGRAQLLLRPEDKARRPENKPTQSFARSCLLAHVGFCIVRIPSLPPPSSLLLAGRKRTPEYAVGTVVVERGGSEAARAAQVDCAR